MRPFIIGLATIGSLALPDLGAAPPPRPDPATLTKVVDGVERVDALRSTLATTFEGTGQPPTQQTFEQVCKPVGMEFQRLGRENGWTVRQVSHKNRNPKHAIPADVAAMYALLQKDAALQGAWGRGTFEGQRGYLYVRRVEVETSCLACHGAKDARPEFVKANYPDDKAYDFAPGDLRGAYVVFVPEGTAK